MSTLVITTAILRTKCIPREYVRTRCWLVNTSGRRDGFCAVDMAQEHNVRDVKVSIVLGARADRR